MIVGAIEYTAMNTQLPISSTTNTYVTTLPPIRYATVEPGRGAVKSKTNVLDRALIVQFRLRLQVCTNGFDGRVPALLAGCEVCLQPRIEGKALH